MAVHSIGRKEGLTIARKEILWEVEQLKNYRKWDSEILTITEEMVEQIPYIENILEIKGLGIQTVTGISCIDCTESGIPGNI